MCRLSSTVYTQKLSSYTVIIKGELCSDLNRKYVVHQSRMVTNTDTEDKHPQPKRETRLPKYDSQSGTMIDSCL